MTNLKGAALAGMPLEESLASPTSDQLWPRDSVQPLLPGINPWWVLEANLKKGRSCPGQILLSAPHPIPFGIFQNNKVSSFLVEMGQDGGCGGGTGPGGARFAEPQ